MLLIMYDHLLENILSCHVSRDVSCMEKPRHSLKLNRQFYVLMVWIKYIKQI